jgi:hypothetical protein
MVRHLSLSQQSSQQHSHSLISRLPLQFHSQLCPMLSQSLSNQLFSHPYLTSLIMIRTIISRSHMLVNYGIMAAHPLDPLSTPNSALILLLPLLLLHIRSSL